MTPLSVWGLLLFAAPPAAWDLGDFIEHNRLVEARVLPLIRQLGSRRPEDRQAAAGVLLRLDR